MIRLLFMLACALSLPSCTGTPEANDVQSGKIRQLSISQLGTSNTAAFVTCDDCNARTPKRPTQIAAVTLQPQQGFVQTSFRPPEVKPATPAPAVFSVYFELNSASLDKVALMELETAINVARAAKTPISIAGRTDPTGPEAFNQTLAKRRAQAVFDHMASLGVPTSSMTAVAQDPCCDGDTTANQQSLARLRRADIKIVSGKS